MRSACMLLAGSLLALLVSCHPLMQKPAEKVLFTEDFESYPDNATLPAGWWSEGSKAVRIEGGHLRTDANLDNNGEDYGTSTVWLERTFSGNLRVEFDAHVLASDGDKNNINFFFLFSDPSGEPLRQTSNGRADGEYGKYHKLNGYVFTFLADGNPDKARFRMRDDPGFNLLQESFTYECRQNKTYQIAITKEGDRITFAVDGTVYLDKAPRTRSVTCGLVLTGVPQRSEGSTFNPEHKSGVIGFRTWHTDLWWDNLKITELRP